MGGGEWEEGGGGSGQEEEIRHIYRILVPMGYLMELSQFHICVCERFCTTPTLKGHKLYVMLSIT